MGGPDVPIYRLGALRQQLSGRRKGKTRGIDTRITYHIAAGLAIVFGLCGGGPQWNHNDVMTMTYLLQ